MNDNISKKRYFQVVDAILLMILALLGFSNAILMMLHGINSERLSITALYDALMVDKLDFAGWNFSEAPQFFPDIPLFFLSKWIFPNLIYSYTLNVIFLLGLISIFCLLLIKTLKLSSIETFYYLSLTLLTLSAILSSSYNSIFELFWPILHGGGIICGLALIILAIYTIHRRYNYFSMVIQLILAVLLITSDSLIISQYLLPILSAMIISSILGIICWRITLKTFISYSMGYIISQLILWFLRTYLHFSIPNLSLHKCAIDWFISDFRHAGIKPEFVSTILCVIACAVTLIMNRKILNRSKAESSETTITGIFLAVFFLSQALIAIIAPITIGTWYDIIPMVYFSALWVVSPILIIWFLAFNLSARGLLNHWLKNVVIGGLLIFSLYNNLSFLITTKISIDAPYPVQAQCIDDAAREFSVKFAYGDYSMAKYVTYLSKSGLKVRQVDTNLNPYTRLIHNQWLNNAPLPHGKQPVMFLTKDLNTHLIIERYNKPDMIRNCPEVGRLFVYFSGAEEKNYSPQSRRETQRKDKKLFTTESQRNAEKR